MDDKKFTILQWNARSLDKNFDQLIQLIPSYSFHIICLQSPNVKKDFFPKIKGYFFPPITDASHVNSKAFTAIYVRSDIDFCQHPLNIPQSATDIYACAVRFKLNNIPHIVISTYLPKGPKDNNTDWIKNTLDTSQFRYIITGDFNAHSPLWEKNCTITTNKRFLENILDSKLYLLNNGQYTRIPDNPNHSPTAIDLTLVSPELATSCSWSPWNDTLNSDHFPIIITFDNNHKTSCDSYPDKIPRFNYKLANWDTFALKLYETQFNKNIFDSTQIDFIYNTFTKAIINAAKASMPQLKSQNTQKHNGNVWWNSKCEEATKTKKQAFKNYLRNPTPNHQLASKKAKNHANRVISQAKTEYWTNYFNDTDNLNITPKDLWFKIKQMKEEIHQPSHPIQLPNNSLPTQTEKAEAFATTFSTHSTLSGLDLKNQTYRSNIENCQPPTSDIKNLEFPLPTSISDEFSIDELNDQINNLRSKTTSVGLDAISIALIKHLPPHMKEFLLYLFNKCWKEGSIPSIWKESIVIPIHKQGKNPNDINSYRPISLTSQVCKLMEKLIHTRLSFFCEKKSNHPNQPIRVQKK